MKKSRVFFSVIIPTLNEEYYLPKLLDGLTKQDFRDFEIIIVDGLSKDNTVSSAEKYQPLFANRLVIRKSAKPNVAAQRNYGASIAGGKYLIFFDADILVHPQHLSKMHQSIAQNSHRLLAAWVGKEHNTLEDIFISLMFNLGLEIGRKIGKPFTAGYNIVIKKETFTDLGGFREDIKIGEDIDLAARALQKNIKIHILRQSLLIHSNRRYYRQGFFKVLFQYFYFGWQLFFKGKIRDKENDYIMGGIIKKEEKKT